MELTEETFLLYAAKYYENPQCSSYEEFEDDLKRIQYLKRLFNRYESSVTLRSMDTKRFHTGTPTSKK